MKEQAFQEYCNRVRQLEKRVKALEQERCEDTVSRQAVLDYIYNDLGLGDEENGKDVKRQMELERSYKYVKSLPSVTPKTCNDAISRQEVLEYIKGSGAELGHSTENELVCQHIKEFPSVNPQPICEEREKGECPWYAG